MSSITRLESPRLKQQDRSCSMRAQNKFGDAVPARYSGAYPQQTPSDGGLLHHAALDTASGHSTRKLSSANIESAEPSGEEAPRRLRGRKDHLLQYKRMDARGRSKRVEGCGLDDCRTPRRDGRHRGAEAMKHDDRRETRAGLEGHLKNMCRSRLPRNAVRDGEGASEVRRRGAV